MHPCPAACRLASANAAPSPLRPLPLVSRPALKPREARQLSQLYHSLKDTPARITMREVIKIQRRAARLDVPISVAAASLLLGKVMHGSADHAALVAKLQGVDGWADLEDRLASLEYKVFPAAAAAGQDKKKKGRKAGDEQPSAGVTFTDGLVTLTLAGADLHRCSLWAAADGVGAGLQHALVRTLVQLAFAAECHEPVLLQVRLGGTVHGHRQNAKIVPAPLL